MCLDFINRLHDRAVFVLCLPDQHDQLKGARQAEHAPVLPEILFDKEVADDQRMYAVKQPLRFGDVALDVIVIEPAHSTITKNEMSVVLTINI